MVEKQDILLEIGTNELEVAEFGIGHKNDTTFQSFGINVAKVREIIKVPKYMATPGLNKYVLGVFKLRDKIIPLIDLGAWLNEKKCRDVNNAYVIVTEFNQDNFGFLVHKIETIHRMSWEKVLPPAATETTTGYNCITGIVLLDTINTSDKQKIMMMVDFEKIVADINPNSNLSNLLDNKILDAIKQDTEPAKVLVAEDSHVIRNMITDILHKGGFDVVSVNNGKIAWDYIQKCSKEAQEKNIPLSSLLQLIITDIEMPQMDGHALTRKIKEDAVLKEIPVVIFSSLIYEEIRRKGEAIGADGQISKPEIGNLLTIVHTVLEKKKKPA